MKTKIKLVQIKAFRGIRKSLSFEANGRSVLIYGEGGTGKSSIVDAIEWLMKEKLSVLGSSHIIGSLRNAFADSGTLTSVKIGFTDPEFTAERIIGTQKLIGLTATEEEHLRLSKLENLSLRDRTIVELINENDTERFEDLSNIIGFNEIIKKIKVLADVHRDISKMQKAQNFSGLMNEQQNKLTSAAGGLAYSEDEFLRLIEKKISEKLPEKKLAALNEIEPVLEILAGSVNKDKVREEQFYTGMEKLLNDVCEKCRHIAGLYERFREKFNLLSGDLDSIRETVLGDLFKAAQKLFDKGVHNEDNCPLCGQGINRGELKARISAKLEEIRGASERKMEYEESKKSLMSSLNGLRDQIKTALNNSGDYDDFGIRRKLDELNGKLNDLIRITEKDPIDEKIPDNETPLFWETDFEVPAGLSNRINELRSSGDSGTKLHTDISFATEAFKKYNEYKCKQEIFERQIKSLGIIKTALERRLSEELSRFTYILSEKINGYYQAVNPGESFNDIKLAGDPGKKSIQFTYSFGENKESEPRNYFSYSHLICLRIAYFLASADAFNKRTGFIVLDDVISAFDLNHRKRFAELIVSVAREYQVILLTHERDFFSYLSRLVKPDEWLIKEIKWTEEEGSYLCDPEINRVPL